MVRCVQYDVISHCMKLYEDWKWCGQISSNFVKTWYFSIQTWIRFQTFIILYYIIAYKFTGYQRKSSTNRSVFRLGIGDRISCGRFSNVGQVGSWMCSSFSRQRRDQEGCSMSSRTDNKMSSIVLLGFRPLGFFQTVDDGEIWYCVVVAGMLRKECPCCKRWNAWRAQSWHHVLVN